MDREYVAEVFVADDNPQNLHLLVQVLSGAGYKVRVAKSGNQTLKSIKVSEPDILLLDINMPEIDGFEVCRVIREEWNCDTMPIIFLSALNDEFNKNQALKLGADDYISKPFSNEEVLMRVHSHLNIRELRIENENLKKVD